MASNRPLTRLSSATHVNQVGYLRVLQDNCASARELIRQAPLRSPAQLELENCWGMINARLRSLQRQLTEVRDEETKRELLILHDVLLPDVIGLHIESGRAILQKFCYDPLYVRSWDELWKTPKTLV